MHTPPNLVNFANFVRAIRMVFARVVNAERRPL